MSSGSRHAIVFNGHESIITHLWLFQALVNPTVSLSPHAWDWVCASSWVCVATRSCVKGKFRTDTERKTGLEGLGLWELLVRALSRRVHARSRVVLSDVVEAPADPRPGRVLKTILVSTLDSNRALRLVGSGSGRRMNSSQVGWNLAIGAH